MRQQGIGISSWLGIAAPRGLPADVKDKLTRALASVMARDNVRATLLRQGVEPEMPDPEKFRERVAREIGEFRAILQRQ